MLCRSIGFTYNWIGFEMFGFYRTMLAVWVMAFHLLDIRIIGPYAVFSFFVLSGFLMTTIMHDAYGYNKNGITRYAINRFLRLYPMYWVVVIFSIVVIYLVTPEYSFRYKSAMQIPETFGDLMANISMIFPSILPYNVQPRLSPPTWALTIEIFFYICIALGISKNRKITVVWVMLSITYFVWSYMAKLGAPHRYASIFGASLPFSLGALLYYYKSALFCTIKKMRISSPVVLLVIYALNAAFFTYNAHYLPFAYNSIYLGEIGKYINILLSMLVISSLYYRGNELMSDKVDKIVGDFSYPIYLVQWQCGLLASFILYDQPIRGNSADGLFSFLLALVIALIVSFILIRLVDTNISTIRNKIKTSRNNWGQVQTNNSVIERPEASI